MRVLTFEELISREPLSGRRVFIRADLNVPIDSKGNIVEDTRIRSSVPAIKMALAQRAAVMVASHLGRPEEGNGTPKDSWAPVAKRLSEVLEQPVRLIADWVDGRFHVEPGEVVLLENCRLNQGEKDNHDGLARKMAKLCDVFVHDAFGTAHRAEASTYGIAEYAPIVCAGPLLAAEMAALDRSLARPKLPLVAIVGGAKVSTKLAVLSSLAENVDCLIVGGGIANTFLLAKGYPVGKSLVEKELLDQAHDVLAKMAARGGIVPLPVDVMTSKYLEEGASASLKSIHEVASDDFILDIGFRTIDCLVKHILSAGSIVWNGPVGVFEIEAFSHGTEAIARAVAAASGFSIAGGGDTLAAIAKYGLKDKIDYISTGGGAFLEVLEGKVLPAFDVLQRRESMRA